MIPPGSTPFTVNVSFDPLGLLVRVMVTLSIWVSLISIISTSVSLIGTAPLPFWNTVAKSLPPVAEASKSRSGATLSSFRNELEPFASVMAALGAGV